jgi:DNA-binding NarL/FixJ family response regulator
MKRLRILIADDHEMVRRGLRSTLAERRDWEICGEVEDGREAVKQAREINPDVIIMDIAMPGLNGLEATRQIRQLLPKVEVLILTMHDSEELVRETLQAGARGYVLKNDAGSILVQAVESLSQHQPFFSSRVTAMVLDQYLHPGADKLPDAGGRLSAREREILQLVAEGKSSKQVASTLAISVKTAEAHRSNILRKLNLHSATELVRYAIRNKLIEP